MSHANYIISDTHFNHKNIIEYANRPFKSVKHMNNILIKNWNNTVKKNDTIYILGDFTFGNKDSIKELVSKLNGRKILILGNHDRSIHKQVKFWYNIGFYEVYKHPIIFRNRFILSHEPIDDLGRFINLHGHIHDKQIDIGKYINASVEHWNYTPINLDKLISTCSKIEDKE